MAAPISSLIWQPIGADVACDGVGTTPRVPAGKIGTVGSAIDLATSLDLEPIVSFGDESCSQVRHPITYSATPVTRYQPPPRLGADNDEVRRWLSGESAS
jgi:formyl-CoA transferase